jgi:hypothetical protein
MRVRMYALACKRASRYMCACERACEFSRLSLRQIATLNRGIGKHSALFVVSQRDSQQQEGQTD